MTKQELREQNIKLVAEYLAKGNKVEVVPAKKVKRVMSVFVRISPTSKTGNRCGGARLGSGLGRA